MQMIDVVRRQERVQRRVDRRGDAIVAERTERIEADHLVFVRFAAIARDETLQLVEIQQREPARADGRTDVAEAFDGRRPGSVAGEKITAEFEGKVCLPARFEDVSRGPVKRLGGLA